MCGLFGFAGPRPGDAGIMTTAAVLAARRGPDAWGMLGEHLPLAKRAGRLCAADTRAVRPGRYLVGHCRLATVLGNLRADAAQPLVVGPYAVTHNGSVENADSLAGAFGFRLQTGNDSEALAHLVGALSGTLAQRVDAALVLANTGEGFALAVLDMATGEVVLRRRELPLFVLNTQAGRYWCSIRPDSQWEMLK